MFIIATKKCHTRKGTLEDVSVAFKQEEKSKVGSAMMDFVLAKVFPGLNIDEEVLPETCHIDISVSKEIPENAVVYQQDRFAIGVI